MKAYLRKLCAEAGSPLIARHLVREYLQARILQSLQRAGAMQSIAFHGGTALRFLYDIPRYSEDLDFALERLPEDYNFRAYMHQINRDFLAESYTLDFKISDKGAVHKAFVRFVDSTTPIIVTVHSPLYLRSKLISMKRVIEIINYHAWSLSAQLSFFPAFPKFGKVDGHYSRFTNRAGRIAT